MKANIKKTIFKEDTNICAWIQQYDDNGNYDEFFVEELKPKDIPKEVVESFEAHHKVVIFVAPGVKVGVFAKKWQDIKEYLNIFYSAEEMREWLGEYSEDEVIQCKVISVG